MKHGILCHLEKTYTKKTQKNRCQRWHSAVSCCCYHTPPQAATPCCRHCCHCLIRGSSGGTGMMAACGGGRGSSSRDGSGGGSGVGSDAILFLIVVVILLLFARPLLVGIVLPLLVAHCSFRRPPLARLQRAMVGFLFALFRCPLCRRPLSSYH